MNIKIEKAVSDVRTMKSLASAIDELLLKINPSKETTESIDRIQNLLLVLLEKTEVVCNDLYELELDSRLVDVFMAIKEARLNKKT